VFGGHVLGGFIHALLVITIIVMLIKVYQERILNS